MRLATILFTAAFLLTAAPLPDRPAHAEPGASLVRTSDTAIETLERLHHQAESQIVGNDFDGAIRTYSDILLIEPDDETAYTGLGNCYLLLGQFKNANEAYRNALAINPENESAILGIKKIMDPDGLEGMIHPAEIEAETEWPGADPTRAMESLAQTLPHLTRAHVQLPAHSQWHRLKRREPQKSEIPLKKPAPPSPAPKKIETQKPKPKPISVKSVPAQKASPKKEAPAPPAPASLEKDVMDPREIQKALRNTGFYSGPIDGVLGPVSRKAIKEFQSLHALAPDGVVGQKTWASLRLYLDSV